MSRVCVIGMWHLGCVTSACLAKWHQVTGCDTDEQVIAGLKAGKPPILEPGLKEAIRSATDAGTLSFSGDIAASVKDASCIVIAFDTPVDENDSSDLSPVFSAIEKIIPCLGKGQVVVVSSQVPVGTCRKLLEMIRKAGKGNEVACVPENLRLGSAIGNFLHQDRLVIGLSSNVAKPAVDDLFGKISGARMEMGLESAEMAKHAMNAYLATLISFSGEISDLCEKEGADAKSVMGALLSEARVSPRAPLLPGLGFGGGTLARDLQSLRKKGRENGVATPILDAALSANQERKGYVRRRLCEALGDLSGKTISFFGLTYKPNTDTLRRSLALEIIGGLENDGAELRAYDPAVKELGSGCSANIRLFGSALECASKADAVVITTGWEEFAGLDYGRIASAMRTPIIIDARNLLDRGKLPAIIRYYGVGVGNGK